MSLHTYIHNFYSNVSILMPTTFSYIIKQQKICTSLIHFYKKRKEETETPNNLSEKFEPLKMKFKLTATAVERSVVRLKVYFICYLTNISYLPIHVQHAFLSEQKQQKRKEIRQNICYSYVCMFAYFRTF